MQPTVLALATMDTKGNEIRFVANAIRQDGLDVLTVDVSTRGFSQAADISARTVAAAHPEGADAVLGHTDRGQAVAAMAEALRHWLSREVAADHVVMVTSREPVDGPR